MNITVNGDVHIHMDEEEVKKSVKNIRTTKAVKSAKSSVKSRDGCCQICGEQSKQLEIHHILPLAKYPELASDEKNMITLCQVHHRKYHELYDGEEGAVSFSKYMRDYGNRRYGGLK